MGLEIQNIPTATRNKINPRLRNYRHDADTWKRQLKKMSFENRPGQSAYGSSGDAAQDQRQQLLSGTERLERGSQRLRDAQRTAAETEDIGNGIMTDLYSQRTQILRTADTLQDADTYVDRSVRTLRGMARR